MGLYGLVICLAMTRTNRLFCSLVCPPLRQYKSLAAAHGGDTGSAAYQQGLSELHQHAATKLLLAVQANGGIYIKVSIGHCALSAMRCAVLLSGFRAVLASWLVGSTC